MTSTNLLVIGGNSDIAHELILQFAQKNSLKKIFLVSQNYTALVAKASLIESQTQVSTQALALDLTDLDAVQIFHRTFSDNIDTLFICSGYLKEEPTDFFEAKKIALINYVAPTLLADSFVRAFEKQNNGLIVGISSVAGIRGRASNYHYGAAKAAFTTYLSGLRNAFSKTPIRVVTVLPGFVNTKMTQHLHLPKRLTASPQEVAKKIVLAIGRGKDVIYVKPIWRYIMGVIACMPEKLFKKMRL